MISVTIEGEQLVVRVARTEALQFSRLIEDGAAARRLAPNEIDYRQRLATSVIRATADLLRARPGPPRPPA